MSDNIISETEEYITRPSQYDDPKSTTKPVDKMGDFIDPHTRNCLIAVPKYHENLFKHLEKYVDWLKETRGSPNPDRNMGTHYNKKVKTPEDLKTLHQLISDLRTEKSELFLDFTFHRKPGALPIRDYINEFLRVKGIFNYYTFIGWYRVTVYKESGDEDCQELIFYEDKDGAQRQRYPRKEYFIIPLFIRLKKNKVYDQFKSIHYNNNSSTGIEYTVKSVNPKHFLRDDDPSSREQDIKNNIKYEKNYVSNIAKYDKIPVDMSGDEDEEVMEQKEGQ